MTPESERLAKVRMWTLRQMRCTADMLPLANVLLWELSHILDGLEVPDLPFDKRPGAKYPATLPIVSHPEGPDAS